MYTKLHTAVLAVFLGLLAGMSAALAQGQLVMATGGGRSEAMQRKYFFDEFEKQTGIKIVGVGTGSERHAKFLAMDQAGNMEWDVMFTSDSSVPLEKEYLVDLGPNCEKVPNVAKLGTEGSCHRYGVMQAAYAIVMAFPTGPGTQPLRSWADFWDVKRFPGPRGIYNGNPWEALAIALRADGVPNDKLFPLDYDRAFRKLDQLKPHVAVWWKTGDQSQQMIRNGEVKYAAMWDGRVGPLIKDGVAIDYTWREAVPLSFIATIPAKSKNIPMALKFLDFYMTRPEAHAGYGQEMSLATSSKAGLQLLPANIREKTMANPENARSLTKIDYNWVIPNRTQIIDKWNAWLAK